MVWNHLIVEERGGACWIILDRPTKLNALDSQVLLELEAAVGQALRQENVAVLVVTGAGEKAFVAGADIAAMAELSPTAGRELGKLGQRVFDLLDQSPKPVIAAINGFALGGGLELALACHLRVASENARFGQPEVKLGLIPGFGGTQRLPRLVGQARALELLLTGAMIDAPTALSWGLVNRVVPAEELQAAAGALADAILAVSPVAVRNCLVAVRAGGEGSLAEGLALEAALFGLSFATEDMREGVAAFLEKRKPAFRGR